MGVETHILPTLERATGHVAVSFKTTQNCTMLGKLYQQGCMKARFPRATASDTKIAFLINTTGGIADGDNLKVDIEAGIDAKAVITSQAAERVYKARAIQTPAKVNTDLTVADGAILYWIPQETILFDGGSLQRLYTVDIAKSGTFLAAEMLVLGRTAMQETVNTAFLFDRWRIRKGGKLIYADGYRLDGLIETHKNSMTRLSGSTVTASLFYVGNKIAGVKSGLQSLFETANCIAACSAKEDILIARFAGTSATDVTTLLTQSISMIDALDNTQSITAPVLSRRHF